MNQYRKLIAMSDFEIIAPMDSGSYPNIAAEPTVQSVTVWAQIVTNDTPSPPIRLSAQAAPPSLPVPGRA